MKLTATERTQQGTSACRNLRRQEFMPAIIYGGGQPRAITLSHKDFYLALKKEDFRSTILEIEIDGASEQVLLRDWRAHPFRKQALHADFLRVQPDHKIRMRVPLHFKGEESSPAVKLDHCLVTHVVSNLEITCLPKDLPSFIEVDLTNLAKDQSIHARDLSLPNGVSVSQAHMDAVIVSVIEPKVEEEKPAGAAAPAAGEAAADAAKKPDEKASDAKSAATKTEAKPDAKAAAGGKTADKGGGKK